MTHRVDTRERVAALRAEGLSYRVIAERLGISKSTVAFHVRRLDEPPDERFARRYDWSTVQAYHDAGHTARECVAHFGFSHETWHAARNRGDLITRPAALPLDELAARRGDRTHVKRRLIAAGLLAEACARCGLAEWRGLPLTLQLHHLNGDGRDHRLENLELLCPNCHSQTDNWGGRNKRAATPPPGPGRTGP